MESDRSITLCITLGCTKNTKCFYKTKIVIQISEEKTQVRMLLDRISKRAVRTALPKWLILVQTLTLSVSVVHTSKVAMTVIPIPETSEGLRGPLKKLMPKYEKTWRHDCKRRMGHVQPLSLVIGVHYSQLQVAPAVAHYACRDQSAPPDEVGVYHLLLSLLPGG